MPNQRNFRSDITTRTEPTFTASRIVRVPQDAVLYEEVPASFGYDFEDNIEMHFYTIPTNILTFSTTINLSDNVLKSHIVSYVDGTYKNYLRIDLTKLFSDKTLLILPGDYRMVLNFFSDEIGNYNNRILTIDRISDSRTEVELSFNNSTNATVTQQNQYVLKEFVEPAFNKTDAIGLVEKIFKSGVELNDPTEGVTATNVVDNIEQSPTGQTFDTTIARIERLQVRNAFEQQLNGFMLELFDAIREYMIVYSDDRIQKDEFEKFIRDMVTENVKNLRQIVDNRIKVS